MPFGPPGRRYGNRPGERKGPKKTSPSAPFVIAQGGTSPRNVRNKAGKLEKEKIPFGTAASLGLKG